MKRLVCWLLGHQWEETTFSFYAKSANTDWHLIKHAGPKNCNRCKRFSEPAVVAIDKATMELVADVVCESEKYK